MATYRVKKNLLVGVIWSYVIPFITAKVGTVFFSAKNPLRSSTEMAVHFQIHVDTSVVRCGFREMWIPREA